MASDKIVAKIIENAEAEAQAMREEAQHKAEKRIRFIEQKTKDDVRIMQEKGKETIEEIQRRNSLMTRLETRKGVLGIKRKILDATFDDVLEKMTLLPAEQWESVIFSVIMDGIVSGDEVLMVPNKDRDRYLGRDGLLTKVNRELQRQGITASITLSDDDAPFNDGVLIMGALSDINASFEALVQDARRRLETKVAQILFPDEV